MPPPPPRKFWNLEAQKCSCNHFQWHFSSERSILGKCRSSLFYCLSKPVWFLLSYGLWRPDRIHEKYVLILSLKNFNQDKFMQDLHMAPFFIMHGSVWWCKWQALRLWTTVRKGYRPEARGQVIYSPRALRGINHITPSWRPINGVFLDWRGFLKGCKNTLTKNVSIVNFSFVF